VYLRKLRLKTYATHYRTFTKTMRIIQTNKGMDKREATQSMTPSHATLATHPVIHEGITIPGNEAEKWRNTLPFRLDYALSNLFLGHPPNAHY
jgi:hypothetical protein